MRWFRLSRPSWMTSLLAGVVVSSSCARDGDPAGEIATWAEWTVDADPLVTIGEVDGAAEYMFSRIAGVKLLPGGRVAVADGSSGTIRTFNSGGELEQQMGGRGSGPGEIAFVGGMFVTPPDTFDVYDSQAFRLTRFLETGENLSTLRFHATSGGRPEIFVGSFSDGSYAMAWISNALRDFSSVTPDVMEIGRFGGDGRFLAPIGMARGMRRLGLSPLPFSAHFLSVMLGDTIFFTDGIRGVVQAIGPSGDAVRSLHIPFPTWDPEEARRQLEREIDSVVARRIPEVEGFTADSIPTIADMLVSADGRLWVKRYEPSTDSHLISRRRTGGEWLVVESNGTIVARVSVPDGFRLMDVSGTRVGGLAHDNLGVERVQVHRLHRQ